MSEEPRLRLTAGQVAEAVDGQLVVGSAETPIEAVSIDTRSMEQGDLYVAIRGERFDGHQFVADAIDRGACGAVVSQPTAVRAPRDGSRQPIVILVVDTIRALQLLGQYIRREAKSTVVAITGSTGKTSTKEIAADFLMTRYRVVRNRGNLNNHIGLPLSLTELRQRPEVAVVELGMSRTGEISALVAIAEPEVRVWTNVAEAHSEFFESIDQIADAKAEILQGATPDSVLVANANDARVMSRAARFTGRVITFGTDVSADVMAEQVQDLGLDGARASLRTPVGTATVHVPLLGRGHLANVLAATAVALQFQIPLATIVAHAAQLRPQPRRGETFRLRRDITLVDDSYNSSPAALRCMLDAIRAAPQTRRRVAVLGEMLELGQRSHAVHESCGRFVAECGFSALVAIGGASAQAFAEGAVAGGMPETSVRQQSTSDDAAEVVMAMLEPGDLVLVKGSRGVRTDVIVTRMKAELT